MNKLLIRLMVVVAFVAVIFAGSWLIGGSRGDLSAVVLPPVDFATMPMKLGAWQGVDEALDPEVFKAVGHNMLVNRIYKNPAGVPISLHCAVFKDYTMGINHNPTLCYGLTGWTLVKNESWPVEMHDGKTVNITFMNWEKNGQRARVVYWFQVGDRFVTGKWDFGLARFDMAWERLRSKADKPWPALIKVLIQTPASVEETRDKQRLEDFCQRVYDWTNDHYGIRPLPEKEDEAPAESAIDEGEVPAAAETAE